MVYQQRPHCNQFDQMLPPAALFKELLSSQNSVDGDSLNLIRLILTAGAIGTTDSTCLCKFDQFDKNDSLFRQFSSGDDLARDTKGY